MSHQLIRFFRCSIQAHRMSNTILLREWNLAIQSVNATGTGIHQMPDGIMPTAFEHIEKTINITFHISIRIFYRIAYTSLCSHVDDNIKLSISKEHLHRLSVFQIHPYETKLREKVARNKLVPSNFVLTNP